MSADTETLAEVLAAHHWAAEVSPPEGVNPYLWCVCGWRSDDATDAHWASGEHARLAHAHVAAFVEARLAARIVQARAGEGALREQVARDIERRRNEHWQQHLRDHPYADAQSCPGDYAAHDAYYDAAKIARAALAETDQP